MVRIAMKMKRCTVLFLLIIICIFRCNGVSWRRQLEHIANRRLESLGLSDKFKPSRRFYQHDPRELSAILGVPGRPGHLPEAEAIQPGHTLLRPSFGMLKSAVKFPHKELEDGAGVYGNIGNLGIRYDARNERTLYSGFRRSPLDYIMVVPSKPKNRYEKPGFNIKSAVLDLERKDTTESELKRILKTLNIPLKGVNVFVAALDDINDLTRLSKKEISHYLKRDVKPTYNLLKLNKKTLRDGENVKKETDRSSSKEDDVSYETTTRTPKELKKKQWLLNSKHSYDHIKVNQDAPDISELLPDNIDNNIREWWFYSADDYKPLQSL